MYCLNIWLLLQENRWKISVLAHSRQQKIGYKSSGLNDSYEMNLFD